MTTAPFPIQQELTSIALAYRNSNYIADAILPRISVGKQEFKYTSYTKAEGFTIPNTQTGRKGRVNEVEMSSTETDTSTRDYALEVGVPQNDIQNASPGQNILGKNTEFLSDLILLDREKRVADYIFTTSNYHADQEETLVGNDQWTDYTNSTPIDDILAGLDSCMMRPNKAVFGNATWKALRQHPDIVAATQKNSGTTGIASREAVAALLELDEILIGQQWYNSAKPGQTATYGRLWTDKALFFYSNPSAMVGMGVTFGLTAQFGGREAAQWEDRNIGMRGGQRIRVGESVKELIVAADCAYLFTDCCA
jgi:hypothetical protein